MKTRPVEAWVYVGNFCAYGFKVSKSIYPQAWLKIVEDKVKKKTGVIDVAIPGVNIKKKEHEKLEK